MSELSLGTRLSNLKSVALSFGAIIDRSAAHMHARTHIHTHTSNENSISAIHSIHLAEIIRSQVAAVVSAEILGRCTLKTVLLTSMVLVTSLV